MKKIFLFLLFFLTCQITHADTILLKNGQIIEGRVTQVRGIFIRVDSYSGTPFKEFLIENVAHIEPSTADEIPHLVIRNMHQRAINKSRSQRLLKAAEEKADALIEEAIQNSGYITLNGASDEVKAVIRQRASALIEEAVITVEVPRLEETSNEVKSIAKEKAGGVIEQAVKDVELLPLQRAPEGVQIAAKQAASKLIEGAVIDAKALSRARNIGIILPVNIDFKSLESAFSGLTFTTKDYIIGVLLILMLTMLLREKVSTRKKSAESEKGTPPVSPLKELEKELEELEKESPTRERERVWAEKRKYPRIEKDLPLSLVLDKVKPISAMVKNFSLGGAYALCNDLKLLRLGDQCQFKLGPFSDDQPFMVYGEAKVVRIRSSRGVGLRFSELDQNSLNYLSKFSY